MIPSLVGTILETSYIVLPGRDMAEISRKRRKPQNNQPAFRHPVTKTSKKSLPGQANADIYLTYQTNLTHKVILLNSPFRMTAPLYQYTVLWGSHLRLWSKPRNKLFPLRPTGRLLLPFTLILIHTQSRVTTKIVKTK